MEIVAKTCSICGAKHQAKGLCASHYASAWNKANREKSNAASRAWKERNKDNLWEKRNPDRKREIVYRWRAKNADKFRGINRDSHGRNKERRNAYSREYRAVNGDHMRALSRAWSKANPEKMRAVTATRRAAKHSATPGWARSEFETFAIREMCALAVQRTRVMGMPWHVDHIVPLKSKRVCGLHCVANLRVILGAVNHAKGNRIWPDM